MKLNTKYCYAMVLHYICNLCSANIMQPALAYILCFL